MVVAAAAISQPQPKTAVGCGRVSHAIGLARDFLRGRHLRRSPRSAAADPPAAAALHPERFESKRGRRGETAPEDDAAKKEA